jgi:murein DD-endopeptidase MepM/ murein hydrolase activator NlpD
MKKWFLCLVLIIINSVSRADSGMHFFYEGESKLIRLKIPVNKTGKDSKLNLKIFNLSFDLFKSSDDDDYHFHSLISCPLGVVEGDYPLTIYQDSSVLKEMTVQVKTRANLKTEEILHAPEINVLPRRSEVVERITREDLNLKEILISKSSERLWVNDFIPPVDAKINSEFGIYRIYSKHLRRRTHWGVDYHVSVGTKVKASSDGIVVLAEENYFPGKTIVIDHGLGLYTGYSHLSKMNVKVGDKVEQGQFIGRSGISGKVTGPHLHWFTVNSRVKFDPLTLLKIKIADKKLEKIKQ